MKYFETKKMFGLLNLIIGGLGIIINSVIILGSHCDCTNNENSFGLSAWNYNNAKEYCDELVIKVKIYIKDIGRVVHDGGKIRCSKFLVLS
jgi:hypothetical protein